MFKINIRYLSLCLYKKVNSPKRFRMDERGSGWMKFLMLTDIFIREFSFVFKFQLTIVADVSATSQLADVMNAARTMMFALCRLLANKQPSNNCPLTSEQQVLCIGYQVLALDIKRSTWHAHFYRRICARMQSVNVPAMEHYPQLVIQHAGRHHNTHHLNGDTISDAELLQLTHIHVAHPRNHTTHTRNYHTHQPPLLPSTTTSILSR